MKPANSRMKLINRMVSSTKIFLWLIFICCLAAGTANIRNAWAKKDENQPDFIAWDGFKALKQNANTKYYSEVLKECGYFNTYIQKAH